MKNKVQIVFICLICWISSQAQSNDFGMWINFELQKKLNTQWSIGYEEELRLQENASLFAKSIHDLGVGYKLTKNWELGFNYQFATSRDLDRDFHTFNRVYGTLLWKDKWGRIKLESRTRFQTQYTDLFVHTMGYLSDNCIRERIKTNLYLNSKMTSFISIESFLNINEFILEKIRVEGGLLFNYSENKSLSISYIIQPEFFVGNPDTDYILKIGHNINF